MKSKGVAYLLWLFSGFGWLGFHRFYLGRYGTGIIWIFTGGLFGFGSLFDLFTLGGKVEQYNTQEELRTIRATTNDIARTTLANITSNQGVVASSQPPKMDSSSMLDLSKFDDKKILVIAPIALLLGVFIVWLGFFRNNDSQNSGTEKDNTEKRELTTTYVPIHENEKSTGRVLNPEDAKASAKIIRGEYTCVMDKGYFHQDPNAKTKRKAYIIKGDKVEITEVSLDSKFGYAIYSNQNGGQTRGWILLSNLVHQQSKNNILE